MKIPDDTPEYISTRFDRVFRARPVLARLGLQYRLCEVGPKRLDHYQLNHEIAERIRTGEIAEPLPGLFRSGRNAVDDAGALLARASIAQETWKDMSRERPLDELLAVVTDFATDAGRPLQRMQTYGDFWVTVRPEIGFR